MNIRNFFQKYKYRKYIDDVAQDVYQAGNTKQSVLSSLSECENENEVTWVDTENTFIIVEKDGQWCKYLNPKQKVVDGTPENVYLIDYNTQPSECRDDKDDLYVGRYDEDGNPDYFICDNYKLYYSKYIFASNGQKIGEYKGEYYAPCLAGCNNKEQTKTETSKYQKSIYMHTVTEEYETKDCGNTWSIVNRDDEITCISGTDNQFPTEPVYVSVKKHTNLTSIHSQWTGIDEDGNVHIFVNNAGDYLYEMYKLDMSSKTVEHEGSVLIEDADYPHGVYWGQCMMKVDNANKTATGIGFGYRFLTLDFKNSTYTYTKTDKTPASSDNYTNVYGFLYNWKLGGYILTGSQSNGTTTVIMDDGSVSTIPVDFSQTLGTRLYDIVNNLTYNNHYVPSFCTLSSDWLNMTTNAYGGRELQTCYTTVNNTYGSGVSTLRTEPVLEENTKITYSQKTVVSQASEGTNRHIIVTYPSNGGEINYANISINNCGTDGLMIYDGTDIRFITDIENIVAVNGTTICRIVDINNAANLINFIFY